MKGRYLLPVVLTLLFPVSSCQGTTSGSEAPSSSKPIVFVEKKLSVKAFPKLDYAQYDRLDLSGLQIQGETYHDGVLMDVKAVDSYEVTLDGQIVQDGERIKKSGDVVLEVSAPDYLSTSFTLSVSPRSDVRQSLEVTSLPRLSYRKGESFDPSGLVVMLETIYYDENGKRVSSSQAIKDYTLSIDGEEADSFVLDEERSYPVLISYDGYVKTLSASFFVYVMEVDADSPQAVVDETIVLPDDKTKMKVQFDVKEDGDSSDKGYYSPDEVEIAFDMEDYGKANYFDEVKMPSVGNTPVLVVPVVYPGFETEADGEKLYRIRKAFFGDSADMEFESLHSYYYKASGGKLDITGLVTDYYDPKKEGDMTSAAELNSAEALGSLAENALSWVEKTYSGQGFDIKDYDSDKDGVVDALWLIYAYPGRDSSHLYSWALTTSTGKRGTLEEPAVNTFGFAGTAFLQGEKGDKECDAHVLIHETGHMLGLNDYYSFNTASGYAPLGGADMMDHNVGDQNPYSKMLLGWTKPYVVTGDCTIDLASSQSTGFPLIVFAEDGKDYPVVDGKLSFNPFDEYLVLDLYSPVGMNAVPYLDYDIAMPEEKGGRLYHVDNRLGILAFDERGNPETLTLPEDPLEPLKESHSGAIYRAFYNTEKGDNSEQSYFVGDPSYNLFDEIRWLSADPSDYASSTNVPDGDYLFQEGDAFSLDRYLSQFNMRGMDNGKAMTTTFVIQSID